MIYWYDSSSMTIIIPSASEKNIVRMLELTEAEFPYAQIITANDRYRKGKGWAVREALSQATGNIIAFIDGDIEIHPKMIKRLLPHLNEFPIVVGKKDTRSLFTRWILTLLSRIYIRVMFGLKVDTQTGVKVFKRAALPSWRTDSFAFDIEILAKAKALGFRMFEVTIDADCKRRMKMKAIINTLLESIKIKLTLLHNGKKKNN